MGRKHIPLLLWILGAGLWSLVFVDRCTGDDGTVVAVREAVVDSGEAIADSVNPPVAAAKGPVGSTVAKSGGGCIDINRAGEKELDALPGIGPAIAKRIIEYRTRNGRFAKFADLDAVKGIGPATLSKLEGRVCF